MYKVTLVIDDDIEDGIPMDASLITGDVIDVQRSDGGCIYGRIVSIRVTEETP